MGNLKITKCPMCGSDRIRRVTRDVRGTLHGVDYVARRIAL